MKPFLRSTTSFAFVLACMTAQAQPQPGSVDVRWNEGAPDCTGSTQPPLQVHRYNANTYVLRENPCATYEAPFLYLLIGTSKALLIDSGAVADAKVMPLADTVMDLLPDVGGDKLRLTVVHTHSHRDHRAGDVQFQSLPGVTVAAADLDGVRQFFGLTDWPNGSAQVDLGDRIVDVIPTPGHTDSHVSYYDRRTALLFTGDFLLPGRLIIDDSTADLASAQRIAAFAHPRPISHVLGSHIELDVDGRTLPTGSTHHPRERALPLSKQDVLDLPATVASFNGLYSRHGMYVMYNQSRVLITAAVAALVVLIGLVALLVRIVRRRRAKAAA
ncbi:MAG TPA: MBL fold metallo-hydrolase [Lysobacter sp.]|nr:MBL fold metallo-hydrolase [Lysobacter sp.]